MRSAAFAALAAVAISGCLEPPRRPDAGVTPCDPFADGGTCQDDQTCQFVSETSFGCVAEGTAGDHASCASEHCARGFLCDKPTGASEPLCLGLCRQDSDCPQDLGTEMCLLALYSGGPSALCRLVTPCEPLVSPTSCASWQKCSLWRLPGPYFCIEAGEGWDYEPCEAETDCAAGFACVGYGTGAAQCVGFCGTDDDCPQTGGRELCLRRNYPDRPPILCERVETCTPGESTCPSGQSCYPYQTSSTAFTVQGICRAAGTGAEGSRCQYLNDCASGLVCQTLEDSPTCRRVCTTDSTLPCPDGHSCLPINSRFGTCL